MTPLVDVLTWRGIEIRRREGEHGCGPVLKEMGKVMGFSLEASGEPSVYWSGDTVFYPTVEETVRSFRPDVVVTHSCGAVWDGTLIVMDANQTLATLRALPEQSVVVATHMEALDMRPSTAPCFATRHTGRVSTISAAPHTGRRRGAGVHRTRLDLALLAI